MAPLRWPSGTQICAICWQTRRGLVPRPVTFSCIGPARSTSPSHPLQRRSDGARRGWAGSGRGMHALNSACLTHQTLPLAPQQIGGRNERPGLSGRTPGRDGRECPQSHPGPTLSLVPVGMWEMGGAQCEISESALGKSADPHLPIATNHRSTPRVTRGARCHK